MNADSSATTSSNPVDVFVAGMSDQFLADYQRTGDKDPIVRFKRLALSIDGIRKQLGGLEHEVALHALKAEFSGALAEIRSGTQRMFREFIDRMRSASAHARASKVQRRANRVSRNTLDKLVEKTRADDPDFARAAGRLQDSLAEADKIDTMFVSGWRIVAWHGLQVDAKILFVYLKYLAARFLVFLQFHAFILIVTILVLGIGYSAVTKEAISTLTSVLPQRPWLGPTLLVGAYLIKKYVIDKRLKGIQKKIETRLYRQLSVKLLVTRTLALRVRVTTT